MPFPSKRSAVLALVSLTLLVPGAARAADKPEIVSVKKIWDAAPHSAFTDLIRFHDKWYCTFRESQAHVGGNGKIRVITSDDGDAWTSAALIEEEGVEVPLRLPEFSDDYPALRNELAAASSVAAMASILRAVDNR